MVLSRWKRVLALGAWLGIVLGGAVLDSRASGLTLAPTRLMFDGKTRVATVHLSNRSSNEATYRILLRDKRMLESGRIVDMEAPQRDERPAAELVRFSPRRVVLGPNESQTVRVMLRNPSSGALEPGEYRTHLIFQSVPPTPQPGESDGRIVARAILETSIPVIIRRDNPTARISFGVSELDTVPDLRGRPILHLDLQREGERSIYGDLSVDWVRDGSRRPVARLNGLGVYHPTPRRLVDVPLTLDDGAVLDRGELRIRFEETELGRGDLSAETVLDLEPLITE